MFILGFCCKKCFVGTVRQKAREVVDGDTVIGLAL